MSRPLSKTHFMFLLSRSSWNFHYITLPCCFVISKVNNTFSLTQFDKDEMASDNRSSLLQRRDEMLLLSERCFNSALGIEDGEPWLHHYILGKITEKLKKPPSVYLEHYQKVCSLLTVVAEFEVRTLSYGPRFDFRPVTYVRSRRRVYETFMIYLQCI